MAKRVCLAAVICALHTIICHSVWAADEATTGEKLFALKVQPLFAKKCLDCHGKDPSDLGGEFDMRSRDAMLKGGESFGDEVLIPGKGERSMLYIATTRREEDCEMPPKEAERLTTEQTLWIRDWIKQGAPWPNAQLVATIRDRYASGSSVATSGGLSDTWTNRRYESKKLWAYRPLHVDSVPQREHPIDWFIERRLAAIGLTPAPDAKAGELARRLSFDLTGLPPTEERLSVSQFEKAFAADPDAAVLAAAHDLMSSPHFGEHFGRHWLDVARYVDSAGLANDYARPNAWRYRDYVIRSFNEDKPYDAFVREQIAGDEIDAGNSENLIATGFLRMGPWEQTSMSVFRLTRQQWLDDVTDSVGQTFLGHPLLCAKCHDHKFDPIPTRDYYSVQAAFSTTQFAEPDVPFLPAENQIGFQRSTQWTQAKIAAYQKQRRELKAAVAEKRKQETGDARVGDNGLSAGDEASLGAKPYVQTDPFPYCFDSRLLRRIRRGALCRFRTRQVRRT